MKTEQAINDFLLSRLALNVSQATITWYQAKLQRFARFCSKLPKDPRPIEAFLAGIKPAEPRRQYSLSTKRNYFNALRALFKFINDRHDRRNPMSKMRAPGHSGDELMATLEADETMMLLFSSSSHRDRAILTLLVDSGIRSGELAGLRKQDIGAETITICGKTGKRQVAISEETRRLLRSLVAEENSQDDYVFHGHKGPLTRHGVYRIVHEYMKRAGIQGPKLGPHRIRHGFGKNYLVNGGDLRSLQLLMGHKRITTTEKYTALLPKDIIKKHHQFTPLLSARAAAQESFFDKTLIMKEVEEIMAKSEEDHK
ncbi:Tyrosine recombinase XerC [subsurface metagenome]